MRLPVYDNRYTLSGGRYKTLLAALVFGLESRFPMASRRFELVPRRSALLNRSFFAPACLRFSPISLSPRKSFRSFGECDLLAEDRREKSVCFSWLSFLF